MNQPQELETKDVEQVASNAGLGNIIGKTVQTTPQYESLYFGKRLTGEVVNFDRHTQVVTFLCNGGKEMLNLDWLNVA